MKSHILLLLQKAKNDGGLGCDTSTSGRGNRDSCDSCRKKKERKHEEPQNDVSVCSNLKFLSEAEQYKHPLHCLLTMHC